MSERSSKWTVLVGKKQEPGKELALLKVANSILIARLMRFPNVCICGVCVC